MEYGIKFCIEKMCDAYMSREVIHPDLTDSICELASDEDCTTSRHEMMVFFSRFSPSWHSDGLPLTQRAQVGAVKCTRCSAEHQA
jgi:hypothetical protein